MSLCSFRHVLGAHVNLIIAQPAPLLLLHQMVAPLFPSLLYKSKQDAAIYKGLGHMLHIFFAEMGYFHLQATRPDTIGEFFRNRIVMQILQVA